MTKEENLKFKEDIIKKKFKESLGYELNLENPKTFNEKLQWLKLYYNDPLMTKCADKYLVREYVSEKGYSKILNELYGAYDKFSDIDISKLPNKFVIKCTHGCAYNVICRDKKKFNYEETQKKVNSWMNEKYGYVSTELHYLNIKPRIIVEKYISDMDSLFPTDYKFYCFDGYVDSVLVCVDRQIGQPKFYFFDENWKLKRYNKRGKEAPEDFALPKPQNLDKMFEIAHVLSKGIPFVRVDLYNVRGKIYFGELTFFPASGFDSNRLPEADMYFGRLIKLPKN